MGRPRKHRIKETKEQRQARIKRQREERVNAIFEVFKTVHKKGLCHSATIKEVMAITGITSPSGVELNLKQHPDYINYDRPPHHVYHHDMEGQKYGNWTALKYLGYRMNRDLWEHPWETKYTYDYREAQSHHKFFLVQCSCGSRPRVINMTSLRNAAKTPSRCSSCAAKERWNKPGAGGLGRPKVPAYVKSKTNPRQPKQEYPDIPSWLYGIASQSAYYEDDEEQVFDQRKEIRKTHVRRTNY